MNESTKPSRRASPPFHVTTALRVLSVRDLIYLWRDGGRIVCNSTLYSTMCERRRTKLRDLLLLDDLRSERVALPKQIEQRYISLRYS